MALDLYQRLGLKRGASEAEIKKAYRSLAKQLHPDRNKDNPDAAKRFGEITHAYDLLSDKDKRARYDRGEIDEDGNPKMPLDPASGAIPPAPGARARRRTAGLREYELRRRRRGRLERLVRRPVRTGDQRTRGGQAAAHSAAFASAPARRRRAPTSRIG